MLYERRALLVASLAAAPVDLFRGDNDADGERETVREATRGACARRARGGQGDGSPEKGAAAGDRRRRGEHEWSATGRVGASLADLQRVNFTFRATAVRLEADGDGERGWERKG